MFERFTDGSRRVIVLAQDESRLFDHNYIGNEHLLLGLAREAEQTRSSISARELERYGVTLGGARAAVADVVGRGAEEPSGHIPFTAAAKRVLEAAFRDSVQFGVDAVGTEHLLLALLRSQDATTVRVLAALDVDVPAARHRLTNILSGDMGDPPNPPGASLAEPPHADEGSVQFVEAGETPDEFARRVGLDPNLRVVLDHATANAVVYVLEGLEQMFRLDPPTAAQMRHFPEPFEGFARSVLEGALEEVRRQIPPAAPKE